MFSKNLISKFAFIDQALVSGCNFITGILLARFLGISGYGEYVLVYGSVLLFLTIQMAFVISPMMAKGPRITGKESEDYYSAMAVQQILLCSGIALFIIISCFCVGKYFGIERIEQLSLPLSIATFVVSIQNFYRRYFFVVKKPRDAFVIDIMFYGLQMLLIVIFGLSKKLDLFLVLWIMAVGSSLSLLYAYVKSKKKISVLIIKKEKLLKIGRDSYGFGVWLFASNMLYWGQTQFINYLSAGLLSVEVVGALNAGKNILGGLNVFFLGLQNILLPDSSRAYQNSGIGGLNRYLKKVTFWGGALTLIMVLVGSIWSEKWMGLLYGKEYVGYGWIVTWWGIYFIISFIHRPLSAGLSVLEKTRSIFISMIIGSGIFIGTGYLFIVSWEIKGIMFIMCFCNLITVVGLFYLYRCESGNRRNHLWQG